MMLLSSLLGPVKPPVASREDVAASPGVYKTSSSRRSDGVLQAATPDGAQKLLLAVNERCLVCLCEYDVDEDLRQLNNCSHLFHQECIETVSIRSFGHYCLRSAPRLIFFSGS